MHIIRNIRLFFVLLLLISYCSASDSETSIKDSLYERAKLVEFQFFGEFIN